MTKCNLVGKGLHITIVTSNSLSSKAVRADTYTGQEPGGRGHGEELLTGLLITWLCVFFCDYKLYLFLEFLSIINNYEPTLDFRPVCHIICEHVNALDPARVSLLPSLHSWAHTFFFLPFGPL